MDRREAVEEVSVKSDSFSLTIKTEDNALFRNMVISSLRHMCTE